MRNFGREQNVQKNVKASTKPATKARVRAFQEGAKSSNSNNCEYIE